MQNNELQISNYKNQDLTMLNDLLKNARTILCLNSTLPIDTNLYHNKCIIAADGAANRLHELGISSDVIIGDFDSVNLAEHKSARIIHMPDQSSSDFQKALRYIDENKLNPFVIFGMNDGFFDHVLCNISILATEIEECAFYAPPIVGRVIGVCGTYHFNAPSGSKISILGAPTASLSSQGLKWELTKQSLVFPGNNSCFNRTMLENVEITLHSGKIILMVYMIDINDQGKLADV
jgi:thiamine pyrophosphokinase